jgi:FkbM family methyltransferase
MFKNAFGWTLPAGDRHFEEYLANSVEAEGRKMYQPHHIINTVKACRQRRVAVDVGAHVGFWSYYLSRAFRAVHAFEPTPLFRECFAKNVPAVNVTLYPVALGQRAGSAEMVIDPVNSGATHLRESASGDVEIRRLDDYELDQVDLIKIDVEGFEPFVLEGARETLLRCRPIVIIEQYSFGGRYGTAELAGCKFLDSLGARRLGVVVCDHIYGWP